jgi:dTDP-glucose pyrophosphorylase
MVFGIVNLKPLFHPKILKTQIKMNRSIISDDISLREAINRLNETGTKTLVVSDQKNQLLGTISDGDIRRAIINGSSLDENIENIYNKNPKYVLEKEYSSKKLAEEFVINKYDLIPMLDTRKKIKKIIFLEDLVPEKDSHNSNSQDIKVIIMAGGLGKRLLPMTENIPKPMIKVGDNSMIEIVIENFKKFGFVDFLVSVNFLSDQITSHLKDGKRMGVNIDYIKEDEPLGTAGSLSLIENIADDRPYIVTNTDVIIDLDFRDLVKHHTDNKADITICTKFHEISIPYGVVNSNGTVKSIQEKPSKSYWVNSGLYVLSPNIINKIDSKEYIDMTDLITKEISEGSKVISFPVFGYWKDIGEKEQLDEVRKYLTEGGELKPRS